MTGGPPVKHKLIMNVFHLLFALLILMGVACVSILMVEEIPQELGFDHPASPPGTMLQGPDGYQRHRPVLLPAAAFGVLTTLFASGAVVVGLKKEARKGAAGLVFVLATAFAALLALVVAMYWSSVKNPAPFVLGFPSATAVMLFLFAPAPLVLIVLYALLFPRWIISAEDEQEFSQIVARRRKQRAD